MCGRTLWRNAGSGRVSEDFKPDPAVLARRLLRSARVGTLATSDSGQPFASLVTPATAVDATVLMLLSGLSPHTQHLRAEPRCSLMVMGQPSSRNPQTAPRLTLVGSAAPEPDPALKARWVALHPYAAFYAGLGDFTLWRLHFSSAQFVGGFASAHRFAAQQLAPGPSIATKFAARETDIIVQCNTLSDTLDIIANAHGYAGSEWQMIACDPDGADIGRQDIVLRIDWQTHVTEAEAARAALLRLADAARNPLATPARPAI